MKLISHRKNCIAELSATDTKYGVEVDIRSCGEHLIIHHDPFVAGADFVSWLSGYHHGTLILNVKEEGLEGRLIELMKHNGIEDFFFLDQSFPFLVRWSRLGERRCAVRVSEFESIQTAMSLAGKVDWVWVDCFTRFPLTGSEALYLQEAGFKLCLVSPELHGRSPELSIVELSDYLSQEGINPEAVCTKRPDLWEIQLGES
jgi:hypothetical protein